MFKVDVFKAFDSASWQFLDHILPLFGFGSKWRMWLQTCWSTAAFAIFLNGSPTKSFKSSRGLRQGDPLSPMIFVLAAKVLTQMVMKAQQVGLLSGFKVSSLGVGIPIFQFAEDTLIFANGDIVEARRVKFFLIWYEALTGLKVNIKKSVLYQVNTVCN